MKSKTLQFYEENAKSYADSTLNLDISLEYQVFLSKIKPNGAILDVGCGSGRDLIVFKRLGYQAQGLEGSESLALIAQQNSGCFVEHRLFKEIDWKDKFDGVWCMASLLHIPKNELSEILVKISNSLKVDGIFYATFKTGIGESYDEKNRFFSYYSVDELKEIFNQFPELELEILDSRKDSMGRESTQWINICVQKKSPSLNLRKKISL